MTKTEARRHFGSVHLYWHGPNRCWDARPGRRRSVHGAARKAREQAQQRNDRSKSHESKSHESKWRESMSKMLPDSGSVPDFRAQLSWNHRADVSAAAPVPASASADANWTDRWVNIIQVTPSLTVGNGPAAEIASPIAVQHAMVKPYVVVMLVFVGAVLTIMYAAIIRPS
ncbi:MAG: hypothetical protein HY852_02170 [Bradyrhizobium sp.]|uniref:hypothetical protein n=1 Tax=Bradyrhizobium sp. TaxID=376 RepID=UPI0025C1E2D9|nr:hypothetical protein [Bradyrhizobium sp.]MBI5260607.1 hypothetical protein [Bradyrhizobium sp.]